jgi:hypothetical protein
MITKVYHHWSYYTKFTLPSITCERYLILWQPNHVTKIHNHGGKNCKFHLLYGKLEENVYGPNRVYKKNKYDKILDKGFVDKDYKHTIKNNNDDKISISYHVYK